ncbi:hypothetical protein BN971_01842 [Mycobacterium bohemicum DSM 44277]|uniref:Uncharacterized protein n=2 Tax=Mycobacterium bohemicum TaxID=56425 RepID=A0A1X1QWR5_MYCBE|nr:hypothetical protein [Mycobacterium bohemicum]MCV6970054.1 hypothetical protein [Mycobacterium bohemicum]ORU95814.1 hypothetical protein AWB93_22830 [Mycobacterium bohemicum]CPR10410.1 hypothetical protein BN971_01842 [Mycobacterium bohemicum DSM 44277]
MTELNQIENGHNSERQINWDNYAYTRPIAAALTATFAVPFGNQDMGGGRVFISHDSILEGGVYLMVGSGFDGPSMTVCETVEPDDGYGVGLYNRQGYTQAFAEDQTATTPEAVVALAKKALALASEYDASDGTYTVWTRHLDGSETRHRYRG